MNGEFWCSHNGWFMGCILVLVHDANEVTAEENPCYRSDKPYLADIWKEKSF